MKSDLIITRFKTETTTGTRESSDPKTFFGSKMVDVEDTILVDESEIQYSEVYQTGNTNSNGYQYYEDVDSLESIYLVNLTDLKYDNHTISLVSQSDVDLKNNTQWTLNISWKNILQEYIFYQLKKRRTFKCIQYTDLISENINLYIREYITDNLINRYQFTQLNFYVEYIQLDSGTQHTDPHLLFDPIFSVNVKNDTNLVKNANATTLNDSLIVNYKQTQSSEKYKFNYYFDLIFTKI